MLIFVDESEQCLSSTEYEFAYKDRNGLVEKVILAVDRIQEDNIVTICTADTNEVFIYISDIPKMIKALQSTYDKAFELRKD